MTVEHGFGLLNLDVDLEIYLIEFHSVLVRSRLAFPDLG
jgi:hypothetical protein